LFEGPDEDAKLRAGLLQRATVMARHDLWAAAIEDWSAASAMNHRPLHPLEFEICRRAVAGRHGFGGALVQSSSAALRELAANRPLGKAIVEALMDGLIWRIRDDEERNRALARQFIRQIEGNLGLARVLARRAASRLSVTRSAFELAERADPHGGAFSS
jgi:hypothetical protein